MLKRVVRQVGFMLSVLACIGLLFFSAPISAQDRPVIGPGGGTAPGAGYRTIPAPPSAISTAVMQVAQQKMTTMQQEAVANNIRATDVTAAATALQSAFGNMNESGWTAKLQSWILANAALFTSPNPTSSQLQTGYNALVGAGINETYNTYVDSITNVPLATRQAFINAVQSSGLQSVQDSIISTMNTFSNTISKLQLRGGKMILASSANPWWGIGAEYLGIVGLAMLVAAGAPAIAIAIGVAGAAMGAVAVIEDLNE